MQLSENEFVVLDVLYYFLQASGPDIVKRTNGMMSRPWCYASIRALRESNLIEYFYPSQWQGVGPCPRVYRLTKQGENVHVYAHDLMRKLAEAGRAPKLKHLTEKERGPFYTT